MRALRLLLPLAITVAFLSAVSAIVVGRSETEESTAPLGVTVSFTDWRIVEPGRMGWREGDFHTSNVGIIWTNTWNASDPRLNGGATYHLTEYQYPHPVMALLQAAAIRVENEDGAWVGTGHGIDSDTVGSHQRVVLSGEGAYEGLTAFLHEDRRLADGTALGLIIKGDLPPFPELPEPTVDG